MAIMHALGTFLVLAAFVFSATEDRQEKKAFLGSLPVTAPQRADVVRLLKEKGYIGAFIPEGASPETLLYRGTKQEYEAALEAVERFLHPEWYAPKKPLLRSAEQNPSHEERQLRLSGLQKDLLDQVRQEGKKRWQKVQSDFAGKGAELMVKGAEYNIWYREQHRAILTRAQYRVWAPTFANLDLGPEPKMPETKGPEKKTDEAIFARLDLSEKQKEHVDALLKDIRQARAQVSLMADAEKAKKRQAEIDQRWLSGLEHALTVEQLSAFRAYWNLK